MTHHKWLTNILMLIALSTLSLGVLTRIYVAQARLSTVTTVFREGGAISTSTSSTCRYRAVFNSRVADIVNDTCPLLRWLPPEAGQ